MKQLGVIADVGGTNIRLALVDETGAIHTIKKYLCADYPHIADVIKKYLVETEADVTKACIGIACPVDGDQIRMTNHSWTFSIEKTREYLGLEDFYVINDYTAISMSIPALTNEQKVQIGEGSSQHRKPIAVYGPGTGLGVAHLINHEGTWVSLPGEGGHVDFAPIDENDAHIWEFLNKKYDHVSIEQLLSGLGLVQIYQALCDKAGVEAQDYTPADVTTKGLNSECAICEQTVKQFCRIMGSVGGNLALTMSTFGGVYIAGGIIPRFIEYFAKSDFRERFDAKGRFSEMVSKVPTYVITEEQPGLIGASVFLQQKCGKQF